MLLIKGRARKKKVWLSGKDIKWDLGNTRYGNCECNTYYLDYK